MEYLSSSLINPIAIPATGAFIGTPVSINARVDPHTDAIEVDPLDERTSDTRRVVYGNSFSSGRTAINARSANAPCPTSRRDRYILPVSPTENLGKIYWCIYRLEVIGDRLSNLCASLGVPNVANVRTCVSPLVNNPAPCARGLVPTSHQILRTSVVPRPSGRFPSSKIRLRTTRLYAFSKALLVGETNSSSSASASVMICAFNS